MGQPEQGMKKELLITAGEAAYGANWKSAIQRDLGLNHHQRIVQWVNGERPIPPIENELIHILQERKKQIDAAIHQLNEESKPMNTPKIKSLDAIIAAHPDADEHELMQAWIAQNPMPEITDLQDFKQAVNKSVWAFESGVAAAYFNNCLEIEVSGYRWAIEQAIINRDSSQTMLQAGLDWVEARLQTI